MKRRLALLAVALLVMTGARQTIAVEVPDRECPQGAQLQAKLVTVPPSLGGAAPLTVALSSATSVCAGADIVRRTWSFSDGTPDQEGLQVAHTFVRPGGYWVILTVEDRAGHSDQDQVNVLAFSGGLSPPSARIEASPRSGKAPLTVQFNAVEAAGTAPLLSRRWEFGSDGATSTNPEPLFTYTGPGNYEVRLILTDQAQMTGVDTFLISVQGP